MTLEFITAMKTLLIVLAAQDRAIEAWRTVFGEVALSVSFANERLFAVAWTLKAAVCSLHDGSKRRRVGAIERIGHRGKGWRLDGRLDGRLHQRGINTNVVVLKWLLIV